VAIAGVPPLAGFFSKDEILAAPSRTLPVGLGHRLRRRRHDRFLHVPAHGMTFWGESRVDPEKEPHIHESPTTMTRPLILLAIPAVFLGLLIGFPRSRTAPPVAAAGLRGHDRGQRPDRGGLQLLRHRRRAGDRDDGPRAIAIVVAWRLFGVNMPALGCEPSRDPTGFAS